MNHVYTFIALDIARDREREATESRRAQLARGDARPNIVRRGLATGFALVSRGSAEAARRLDSAAAGEVGPAYAAD